MASSNNNLPPNGNYYGYTNGNYSNNRGGYGYNNGYGRGRGGYRPQYNNRNERNMITVDNNEEYKYLIDAQRKRKEHEEAKKYKGIAKALSKNMKKEEKSKGKGKHRKKHDSLTSSDNDSDDSS